MGAEFITPIISLVMAIGAGVGAMIAYGRAKHASEAQVISVTVEAAESVVKLVSTQLERSIEDFKKLDERVKTLEEALTEEEGRTVSLRLQLGKVQKRVRVLEDFIKAQGWEVPA